MDPISATVATLAGLALKALGGSEALERTIQVMRTRIRDDEPVAEALSALEHAPDDESRIAALSTALEGRSNTDPEFQHALQSVVDEARKDADVGRLVDAVYEGMSARYLLSDFGTTPAGSTKGRASVSAGSQTAANEAENWPEPPPSAIPTSGYPIRTDRVGPSTLEDVALQQRAEALPLERLERVRETAEKWGATTAAVFTAFGFATFLQGRKQIDSLTPTYEVWAGGVILGAFVLAILAVALAALSAQGNPRRRRKFVTGPELRDLEADEADNAGKLLTASRTSATLAVLAVLASFLVLWFAPTDKQAGGQKILLLLRSGETLCGPLRQQGGGSLQIQRGSVRKVVAANDVQALSNVTDCP